MKSYPFDIEAAIDAATPSLLCGQSELERLKREVAKIDQAARDVKRENDYADWQKARVKMPHTTKDFQQYGKEHGENW